LFPLFGKEREGETVRQKAMMSADWERERGRWAVSVLFLRSKRDAERERGVGGRARGGPGGKQEGREGASERASERGGEGARGRAREGKARKGGSERARERGEGQSGRKRR